MSYILLQVPQHVTDNKKEKRKKKKEQAVLRAETGPRPKI